jgi:argininosuccinate synthase
MATTPIAALAFSGGLDTSYAVLALKALGYNTVTVAVDTGGFSDADRAAIAARSKQVGAVAHELIDARQQVYDRFFSWLIRGNVLRGGVYPVAVGAERVVQAEELVTAARRHNAAAVAHGCTAAGNDQIRFEVALRVLAPDLKTLAPIRDGEVSREASTAALAKAGVVIPAKTTRYSINAGLVGTTIGGGETHDPWTEIGEEAWAEAGSTLDAAAQPVSIEIGFVAGLPVSIDGRELAPLKLIATLDALGRPRGIGRGIHLGETILGIKGRIGFVAPAATTLIHAHRELEKLTLTKRQQQVKDALGAQYGDLLHEGLYHEPVCRDIEALLGSSQRAVTGDVRVQLRAGSLAVTGVRSPHALMSPKARYGEGSSMWSGTDAAGFARIYGIPAVLSAGANNTSNIK